MFQFRINPTPGLGINALIPLSYRLNTTTTAFLKVLLRHGIGIKRRNQTTEVMEQILRSDPYKYNAFIFMGIMPMRK